MKAKYIIKRLLITAFAALMTFSVNISAIPVQAENFGLQGENQTRISAPTEGLLYELIDKKDDDNNFILYDINDNDITTETISNEGKQLLILVPEIAKANISYSFLINEMNNYITQQGGNLIGIFATKDKNKIEHWADISLAQWPIYITEDTSIKELARGKIAVVYLEDGIIKWKRTLSSIPSDIFSSNKNNNPLSLLHPNGERLFFYLSLTFIAITIILSLFNWIITSVKSNFSRKNKKKNVTLQNETKINK